MKYSNHIPEQYISFINIPFYFPGEDEEKVTKAGLAAGLTALILFLTVLILIIIWHRR